MKKKKAKKKDDSSGWESTQIDTPVSTVLTVENKGGEKVKAQLENVPGRSIDFAKVGHARRFFPTNRTNWSFRHRVRYVRVSLGYFMHERGSLL